MSALIVTLPPCMAVNGKRVVVDCDPPPIPCRQFDYRARFVGGDEYSPVGYGPTPAVALSDLKSWDDLRVEVQT